ncbi:hypothetical protein [Klebsiella pneumoniae]|uniref:hypothetical protein n=1 Tax=Klebsiella pneumoniae TaxID=573 RepID=UPI000A372E93|nr:hypothetical protein [Klebsiella pneumoniae]OUH32865.1 hypothetical protein AZ023_003543 [Klebsiella pneumoniae]
MALLLPGGFFFVFAVGLFHVGSVLFRLLVIVLLWFSGSGTLVRRLGCLLRSFVFFSGVRLFLFLFCASVLVSFVCFTGAFWAALLVSVGRYLLAGPLLVPVFRSCEPSVFSSGCGVVAALRARVVHVVGRGFGIRLSFGRAEWGAFGGVGGVSLLFLPALDSSRLLVGP